MPPISLLGPPAQWTSGGPVRTRCRSVCPPGARRTVGMLATNSRDPPLGSDASACASGRSGRLRPAPKVLRETDGSGRVGWRCPLRHDVPAQRANRSQRQQTHDPSRCHWCLLDNERPSLSESGSCSNWKNCLHGTCCPPTVSHRRRPIGDSMNSRRRWSRPRPITDLQME